MTYSTILLATIIVDFISNSSSKYYKAEESFIEDINGTIINMKFEILLADEEAVRFFLSATIDVKRKEDGTTNDLVSTSLNKILQFPSNLSNEIVQGLKDTSKTVSLDLNSLAQYIKSVMGITLSFVNFKLEGGKITMKLRPSLYTIQVPYIRFILTPKELEFQKVTDPTEELLTKYLSQKATSNIYETGGSNTQVV
eukprot:GAHX01000044.1.p1 GENE.GAHX01000044.1~~GAHX01000044.1.p1  ORF type:complete len:197 (+),score=19.47 GAHX01000044.1:57-647(+)